VLLPWRTAIAGSASAKTNDHIKTEGNMLMGNMVAIRHGYVLLTTHWLRAALIVSIVTYVMEMLVLSSSLNVDTR
jgi:hypothetical protein